ncbi:type III PLP-dependent enzyme [Marivita sp. S2033]|uniref:type III PLP-dependent enzyme n=1 Tax=Marivita sp. S2033 TaxID=3373187 RepID=UPI0039822470
MRAVTHPSHRDSADHASDMDRVTNFLRRDAPDHPVVFLRPDVLRRQAERFLSGFPGLVSYAVKANPGEAVLRQLVRAGITSFDVASVQEMVQVRQIAPNARLHYHNPVRSNCEIAQARKLGVASWSVDRLSELDKLKDLPEGTEIAVRLSLPRAGGAYDFGSKFGASPDMAQTLLAEVASRGLRPAMTFHPGTQCKDASAWGDYISAVAEVSRRAGVTLHALNVGGGFPSLVADDDDTLDHIFTTIDTAITDAFGVNRPALWCEPGRAMVASSMWLALRVKARNDHALTLNDGLYGALGEWRDMPVPTRLHGISSDGHRRTGEIEPYTIFGPTCDSLDRLPAAWNLPGDLCEDDYILVEGTGAYTQALTTRFNGYGLEREIDLATCNSSSGQDRMAG